MAKKYRINWTAAKEEDGLWGSWKKEGVFNLRFPTYEKARAFAVASDFPGGDDDVLGSCEILEVEKRKAAPAKAKRIVLGRLV